MSQNRTVRPSAGLLSNAKYLRFPTRAGQGVNGPRTIRDFVKRFSSPSPTQAEVA